ncbi:protein rep [Leucobacter sp. W1153]|uniref:protein rep n=1 Tax=Leucobacter sp. W1153 TaxID=3439064 RepID=UPI003F380422
MTVSFEREALAAPAALGTKANTVTPFGSSHKPSVKVLRDLRRLRFARRQVSRDWFKQEALELLGDQGDVSALPQMLPRMAKCGWACSSDVAVHKGEGNARFSGLQTCASIWACPTCAPIIRARRAQEIQHASDWWENENAGSFLFATFTARHFLEDSLETSLSALTQAFTRLIRGAPWKRFSARHNIAHMIKSVEVTLSWNNGWHAHLHVLFFTHSRLSSAATAEARAWLSDRWAEMVVKCGGRRPSAKRGVDLRSVQDGSVVALYISKSQESDNSRKWRIGQEMTRIDSKKGRLDSLVPFDLLDLDGLDAPEVDRQRSFWLEYVETTRGRRATTWSRGLKDACGLEDVPDEEILADEDSSTQEDDVQLLITARDWRYIMNRPDVVARILDLVELGRSDEVAQYVPIRVPAIPKT